MTFQPSDSPTLVAFIVFALTMCGAMIIAIRMTTNSKLWLLSFAALLALFGVLAATGMVADNILPFAPVLFASMMAFGLIFSFSQSGRELAGALSLPVLIGFQGFRLPLELILHRWAEIGTVPSTMTWTGQNWDIVTGVVSIVAIPFVNRHRSVAILTNTLGFLLLLNVFRVVIMSSPFPFSWPLESPLLLVAYFPYNLIAPLFVMPALIGHLVTFRRLFSATQ